MGLSRSGFSFKNILTGSLLMQSFHIQKRKMCFSRKILYQYFVVFYPAWDSFSSENNFYYIALKSQTIPDSLKKLRNHDGKLFLCPPQK